MKRGLMTFGLMGILALFGGVASAQAPGPDWSFNATIIEACSCPMFCQCYFNSKPAEHHEHGGASGHFCRFNNAFRVNKGSYGTVRLDGAKFWVAGDLGADFSQGKMDWAVLTFDKTMTKEQRDAVAAIMGHVYPVKWSSFTTAEGSVDKWEFSNDAAHALLDGGKSAEVKLRRHPGNTSAPVVIQNLKYWGVPRNDGFLLMPNDVEAYRAGEKPYEFKGTNGFMITIDMTSKDVASSGTGGN